jgi:hypothetical protein
VFIPHLLDWVVLANQFLTIVRAYSLVLALSLLNTVVAVELLFLNIVFGFHVLLHVIHHINILEGISLYSQICQDFHIQNSLLRIKKIMTEVLEIISPGSNFSRLLTLPLVFTIIHNMPKKFIQGCENGSTLFALKLILSFLLKDML